MTKPSISLSAVSSETGVPKFGTVDFTEIHTIPRPFPKDAKERRCYQYLLQQMQAAPDRPRATKPELKEFCRRWFRVTVESFSTAGAKPLRPAAPFGISPGAARAKNFLAKPSS